MSHVNPDLQSLKTINSTAGIRKQFYLDESSVIFNREVFVKQRKWQRQRKAFYALNLEVQFEDLMRQRHLTT